MCSSYPDVNNSGSHALAYMLKKGVLAFCSPCAEGVKENMIKYIYISFEDFTGFLAKITAVWVITLFSW